MSQAKGATRVFAALAFLLCAALAGCTTWQPQRPDGLAQGDQPGDLLLVVTADKAFLLGQARVEPLGIVGVARGVWSIPPPDADGPSLEAARQRERARERRGYLEDTSDDPTEIARKLGWRLEPTPLQRVTVERAQVRHTREHAVRPFRTAVAGVGLAVLLFYLALFFGLAHTS